MPFRFTLGLAFALLFGSKTLRQCILRYKLPLAVYMDAYFPLSFATAVITASKVVMVGKINDNINTASRIINELYTMLFVAIPVCGSLWRYPCAGACGGGPCLYTRLRPELAPIEKLLHETSISVAQTRTTTDKDMDLNLIANPSNHFINQ
jgi:hypothetical protein